MPVSQNKEVRVIVIILVRLTHVTSKITEQRMRGGETDLARPLEPHLFSLGRIEVTSPELRR